MKNTKYEDAKSNKYSAEFISFDPMKLSFQWDLYS